MAKSCSKSVAQLSAAAGRIILHACKAGAADRGLAHAAAFPELFDNWRCRTPGTQPWLGRRVQLGIVSGIKGLCHIVRIYDVVEVKPAIKKERAEGLDLTADELFKKSLGSTSSC